MKKIKLDYDMRKFPVITLCGSTKFKEEFIKINEELTLRGYVVISLGLFGHADNKFGNKITPEKKKLLDKIHLKKIDMANIIYVIDVNGYIGESTKNEIEYAKNKGKIIMYYSNEKQ